MEVPNIAVKDAAAADDRLGDFEGATRGVHQLLGSKRHLDRVHAGVVGGGDGDAGIGGRCCASRIPRSIAAERVGAAHRRAAADQVAPSALVRREARRGGWGAGVASLCNRDLERVLIAVVAGEISTAECRIGSAADHHAILASGNAGRSRSRIDAEIACDMRETRRDRCAAGGGKQCRPCWRR